jgi:transposase
LKLLAEGNGIRATARIMEISTNTVKDWLGRAGEHVEEVSDYLMKDLHVEECQLDELWSFIKKRKERRSIHGKRGGR